MAKWACLLLLLVALGLVAINLPSRSSPDQLFNALCRSGDDPSKCISKASFVITRGEGDCSGHQAELCFGTGNDGWDAELMPDKSGMTKRLFEYATLQYRSDLGGKAQRWQAEQIEAIEQRLEEHSEAGRNLYLVVFVHGWHHDAREDRRSEGLDHENRNLLYFKHILAKSRAELDARGDRSRRVVGVYVGWNGGPPNAYLNINSRATAADLIGRSSDFKDDMSRLARAARVSGDHGAGRMLLIGHSLGGRILSRFMLSNANPDNHWSPFGENALVVTLNPAIGADAFDGFMNNRVTYNKPSWINITSKDDWATGWLFPIAAWGRWVVFGRGVTDTYLSWSAYRTIGHFRNYLTHRFEIDYIEAGAIRNSERPFRVDQPGRETACYLAPVADLGSYSKLLSGTTQRGWPKQKTSEKPQDRNEADRATMWYQVAPHEQRALRAIWFGGFETECDSRHYVSTLSVVDDGKGSRRRGYHPVPGRMWNIQTDDNVIKGDGLLEISVAVHNAFVQTSLNRMLIELTFAKAADASIQH